MKQLYKDLEQDIGGYRCVGINPYDKALCGELGDIWECSWNARGEVTLYKAFKVLPSGSHKIFTFESKDLGKWVLRLKVPANPKDQLRWANDRN